MAAPSSSVPLKEYLKRYQSCADEPKKAKKKKKKENTKSLSIGAGVLVLDGDPVWQKPVLVENAEEDNSAGEETPQIEEDVEVKRMKRLEALRSRKPYHSINEDGSGWISVSSFSRIRDISLQQNRHDENPVDVDTDLSHPRQRQRRLDTPSPERQLNGTGAEASDLSPPRRRRVQEFEAGRNLQDTDLSPMRKPGKEPTDDLSPPRRYRESLDADSHSLSRTGKRSLKDLSPPRKPRSSPTVDLSPPRKSRKRSPDDVRSYSLTGHPHRMKSRLESSENPSVMYTARHESPKGGRNGDLSAPSGIKEPSLSKDARRASMFSDKEFGEGTDRRKMEVKSSITSIDPLLSRRGSEVVYRDKQGKRTSKEELMKSKEKKKEEKPLEWGKGLAQKREAEKRVKELELEKEKPFARSRDDPELEKMLKDRIRWGDPMAYLIKRNSSELILEDLGENEKMKDSGFIVPQTVPSHSWLKRGLDFPPNRYSIRPGRHWDGVDRSNGYEKELFKRQNEKRATETEAYLWSVSDM